MELRGSVVFVTGSAKRVGRTIALTLARNGAHLVVHYHRSRRDAQQTVQELEEIGAEAIAVQADQTRPRTIRRAVAKAIARFGRIDVLVNNAALFERTPWVSVTQADWDRHLATNLTGSFFFARAVARGMQRRRCGKIINICDVAAIKPWTGYIPYCAAKAGLLNVTQALAKALAPHVQVNAICPGTVLWPDTATPPVAARRAVRQKTLLHRLGTPDDVAQAVRFLIESDYLTGATLVIDGGRLAY